MFKELLLLNFLLTFASIQLFAASPMDLKLSEDGLTLIECEIKSHSDLKGYPKDGLPKLGTYHYNLHLPEGYHDNPNEDYPLIIIASPGGKAKMGKMAEVIKKNRWIAAMLVESSNKGSWTVMAGNEVAAFDDLKKRVRCKDGFIFSTGMSGGSRAATQLISMRKGLGGVILQAAAFWYTPSAYYQHQYKELNPKATWYGLFGDGDYNMKELSQVYSNIPYQQLKVEVYKGGHGWAPTESISRAFDWQIEQNLLKSKYKSSNKGIYQWYSNLLQSQIEESQNDFQSYELKGNLIDFTKRFKIKADSELKEKLTTYKSDIKTQTKDFKNELSAKKMYAAAESYEVKTQAKLKGLKDVKPVLEAFEKKYLDITKKYNETHYSKISQTRANALHLHIHHKPKSPPSKKKKKK